MHATTACICQLVHILCIPQIVIVPLQSSMSVNCGLIIAHSISDWLLMALNKRLNTQANPALVPKAVKKIVFHLPNSADKSRQGLLVHMYLQTGN